MSIMYPSYQIEVFYSPLSGDLATGEKDIARLYPNVKVKKNGHRQASWEKLSFFSHTKASRAVVQGLVQ